VKVVVDTHGHIDVRHDLKASLSHAHRSLAALGPPEGAGLALVLTERHGEHLFADMQRNPGCIPGLAVRPTDDAAALRIVPAPEEFLTLIAGRQIVTAERLEVLALGTPSLDLADGLSADATLKMVAQAGAFPVVPWSPGKWLGARGRLLGSLLERYRDLGLADSALRPQGLPTAPLLRRARLAGRAVIAGSDPLPLPGEERRLGSYATAWDDGWDPGAPATSLLRLLRECPREARWVGSRCSLLGVAARLTRLRLLRRNRRAGGATSPTRPI
jgi:hypothetical protein